MSYTDVKKKEPKNNRKRLQEGKTCGKAGWNLVSSYEQPGLKNPMCPKYCIVGKIWS